jgi:hypothetical protein
VSVIDPGNYDQIVTSYARPYDPLDESGVPWMRVAFLAVLGSSALLPFFLMIAQ